MTIFKSMHVESGFVSSSCPSLGGQVGVSGWVAFIILGYAKTDSYSGSVLEPCFAVLFIRVMAFVPKTIPNVEQ